MHPETGQDKMNKDDYGGKREMISHGKEIKVFAGNSNPELAEHICSELYRTLGKADVAQFADGECSVSVFEPVRGKDVFIVQSTCNHVNDNLMELLIMIDAMRRASAGRITAVIPYFGYARQDRKAKSRDPISAKLVANLITTAGAAKAISEIGGAKKVYACATHGVLSGPAIERIENSCIEELLLLDTIPYPSDKPACSKIKYISTAPVFAEAIRRIYEEVSISNLFD